jgi:hypothetical protein
LVEVSYELYTQVKGRWNLEARYGASEREAVLSDAKGLATENHIEAVRVVRETYDAGRNVSRESTIYSTVRRSGGGMPVSGRSGDGYDDEDEDYDYEDDGGYGGYGGYGGAGYGGYDDEDDEEEEERKSRRKSRRAGGRFSMLTVILFKVVIIIVISFLFAVVSTYLYSEFFFSPIR